MFDAPRERVFAAFTDPELILEWWGPRDTTTIVEEMDARRGGRWRFVPATRTAPRTPSTAPTAAAPPERIVQTFGAGGDAGARAVETATLEDLGEQTRVRTVSLFHTREERDGMLESGMEEADRSHARFDELMERLGSG